MGDRDLPIYNPNSPGDLDDYWESSASYKEARENREKSIDDKIGNIEYTSDWLRALSISLADEDDYGRYSTTRRQPKCSLQTRTPY